MADFGVPDWSQSIDVEARIAEVPEENMIRGMFVMDLVKAVKASGKGRLEVENYIAFKNYSIRQYMRVAVEAANIAHADLPLKEGLRRLGRTAYPTFAASMAGAAIFAMAGKSFAKVANLAPKAYNVALSPGRVSTTPIAEGHVEVQMRNVWNFPECLQVGVFEGAMDVCEAKGEVQVRQLSHGDIDLQIKWKT